MLALLLLALASSRQAFAAETSDTIKAMQGNCLPLTNPVKPIPSGGATNAACQTCVSDIGNLNGLDSQRMFACYDVCQSSALYTGTTPTTATSSTDCISCIKNTAYTVQACKDCMNPAFDSAASAGCYTCLGNDPWKGETLTPATQYLRDSYFYACAQCSKIKISGDAGAARANCYTCIKSKLAKPQGSPTFGILSWAEENSDGYNPAVGRANDFGACVFLANQSYLVATGSVDVTGPYANCVPKAGDPPIAIPITQCIDCMSVAEQQQAKVTPQIPLKSYGCADICQSLDYYPGGVYNSGLGDACVTCLKDTKLTQAWACGNCMKTDNPTSCFTCVAANKYLGKASNYNWACGMCAKVSNLALRNLCYTCIQSQTGSENGVIDKLTTEANICSCIDLIQNKSIDVSRPLTAMELSCFQPFTKRDSNGVLLPAAQQPAIPWGDDVKSPVGTNTSECLMCMKIASSTDVLPGINKAYACHEYCQNPDLVKTPEQGNDCALCVINPLVKDPWACQTCMIATPDTNKRLDCFTCVASSSTFASHAWGCGQCAQFKNTDASTACYQCLAADKIDPCACVDGVKNGTITPAPQSSIPPVVTVCEHAYGSISCPVNPISLVPSTITSITGVFYGRLAGDSTTCKDFPPNFSCGNSEYCSAPSTMGTTKTCDNQAKDLLVQARAVSQCFGRNSCNVGGFTTTTYSSYGLFADNNNFGLDPCVGVYKYMRFSYTCSPI